MNLTQEEQLVIELFRRCDSVEFMKYDVMTEEAIEFPSMLGDSLVRHGESISYVQATKGKIEATAIIKDWEGSQC